MTKICVRTKDGVFHIGNLDVATGRVLPPNRTAPKTSMAAIMATLARAEIRDEETTIAAHGRPCGPRRAYSSKKEYVRRCKAINRPTKFVRAHFSGKDEETGEECRQKGAHPSKPRSRNIDRKRHDFSMGLPRTAVAVMTKDMLRLFRKDAEWCRDNMW